MPQETLGFVEEQHQIEFPTALTEKYQPNTVDDFLNCAEAKPILKALLLQPKPCSLLFVGPPGTGKTTMALAFARQLRAGLIHIASQRLTVDEVSSTWEKVHYYPGTETPFWVVVCDEADCMSRQAQVALLSKLDSAGSLRPTFGGGSVRSKPLPVIWIFTCNGSGSNQETPPDTLEPRFLSRCIRLPFKAVRSGLADYLRSIWDAEADFNEHVSFEEMAREANGNVRDALQLMEVALTQAQFGLLPKPIAQAVVAATHTFGPTSSDDWLKSQRGARR